MRILDLYDDPAALVLRTHLEQVGAGVSEKVAALHLEEQDVLAKLPDRLFALVATEAGEPLRKYAMHDAAHVATSVVYFLRCGGQLPEDMRIKVAQNLVEACGWYGSRVPAELEKVALMGLLNAGLTLTQVPETLRKNKALAQADDAALRTAQMSGIKQAAGHHRMTRSPEEAYQDLDDFINNGCKDTAAEYAALTQSLDEPNPFAATASIKSANLIGTEAGSLTSSPDPRTSTPQKRFATAPKVSSWQGNFGEFQWQPEPDAVAPATHYALPHRELYPIDTPQQVKRASAYFAEHQHAFTPEDRRCFAQSVATRAEELGTQTSGAITKLAGNTYGPHIRGELEARIRCFEGTQKTAAYEVLLEHLDTTPPIVMYDMLKTADEETGVDAGYGRPVTGFREPMSAVFGAPEKPIYTWSGKGHYVTEEQLRSFTKRAPDLDRVFGDGFSTKFIEDPIKQFDRLPDDKKIVLSRLANNEAFRWY